MASDIGEQESGYPWRVWANTGVLTLAVVLVAGLVVSARHPPATLARQALLPKGSSSGIAKTASPTVVASASNRDAMPATVLPSTSAAPPVAREASAIADEDPANTSPPTRLAAPTPSPKPSLPAPEGARVQPPRAAPAVEQTTAPAAPDARKEAAYAKAVADVRRAMANRDLAAANRLLKTAADNAQSDAQRAEVERLDTIQDHLEQFWEGIRKAVAEMQPTEEIVLSESNRVAVIECSRKELAVQWYGKPQRYRVENLPMELLSAIAKMAFKATPGTKLVIGSFLAVDAHGDRKEARKLWREAVAGGEKDGKLLLPELDVPAPKGR